MLLPVTLFCSALWLNSIPFIDVAICIFLWMDIFGGFCVLTVVNSGAEKIGVHKPFGIMLARCWHRSAIAGSCGTPV